MKLAKKRRSLSEFLLSPHYAIIMALTVTVMPVAFCSAKTLEVGAGKQFQSIAAAVNAAQPGDVIDVYPLPNGRSYSQEAILVTKPQLYIRGIMVAGKPVPISGKGFNYSGRGSTPRAIFQFNPGADGCVLEGFELFGAHNESHNGAGVRINMANYVTIRHCKIHDNDMGIMSNGDGTPKRAVAQVIEHCQIFHNGDPTHPGFNHNLYLGGTSVLLRFCEIHSAITGHNVKSRAHHTRVEYCYIHDSANREFDLVDSKDTRRPESHAVLLGNIIVKDPRCKGNRTVIHFGQDIGGQHNGILYLYFNTIVTPFISPVIDLSASGTSAQLVGNLITDGGANQHNQRLVTARSGASVEKVTGSWNVCLGGFHRPTGSKLDEKTNFFGRSLSRVFLDPEKCNYRLRGDLAGRFIARLKANDILLPQFPGLSEDMLLVPLFWQYKHPVQKAQRNIKPYPVAGAMQ